MKGWLGPVGGVAELRSDGARFRRHDDDQDMNSLMAATGPEFDRMWLTMMIEHHQGAVTMAQDVLATTANPDVEKLAKAVVDGQKKEITTMKGMLS